MNWAIGLILVCVGLGVSGELLLKTGAMQLQGLDLTSVSGIVSTLPSILAKPAILLGFVCYGLTALLWVVILTRLDLSFAYPMYALMYAVIPVAAWLVLHEHIPAGRWVGILLIVSGAFIVFRVGSG